MINTNSAIKPKTILFVDDEDGILNSLVRMFRNEKYRILTANSGQKGLELLSKNDIDLVVSDQRMPNMTGVEFLRQVSEQYPMTSRIIMSGYVDIDAVIGAVNQGNICRFLTKPWDKNIFKKNINDCLNHQENTTTYIRKYNDQINKLKQIIYKQNERLKTLEQRCSDHK